MHLEAGPLHRSPLGLAPVPRAQGTRDLPPGQDLPVAEVLQHGRPDAAQDVRPSAVMRGARFLVREPDVMDLDDWKELAAFSVGDGPDVLALDPGLGRLYVASESGVVSVFQEHGKTVKPIGSAFLANEAHTVAVDPVTHRVYFALENVGGKAVIRVMAP